eukprot:scaffold16.g120.t1
MGDRGRRSLFDDPFFGSFFSSGDPFQGFFGGSAFGPGVGWPPGSQAHAQVRRERQLSRELFAVPGRRRSASPPPQQQPQPPGSAVREIPIEGPEGTCGAGGPASPHRLSGPLIHELEEHHVDAFPFSHSQPDLVEEPDEGERRGRGGRVENKGGGPEPTDG